MTPTELLAALEAATGPSRELDYAIAAAVGWPDAPYSKQHARRYTESMDAALTLVPDGLRIYMERKPTDPPQPWFVTVRPHAKDGWDAASDYPALALCIAAIRARGEG